MSAIWGFAAVLALLLVAGVFMYRAGSKAGKSTAIEDELDADYEVKKGRDRIDLYPDERKRLRDRFR